MKKNEGKIAGILGTVIVHLIAAIIFMSLQLQALKTREKKLEKFEIEFTELEEKKLTEKPRELPPTSVENILHDDVEMLNIARNLSSKSEEQIDAKDYVDKVKEELIMSGKLSTDNYLDRQAENSGISDEEQLDLLNNKELEDQEKKPKESLKMAANYRGPTRIYYDLQGRNHTYLPIPIYKCQGSGKIVLLIEVNQKGYVETARIIEGESTVRDECLIETATESALVSTFEPDLKAPGTQKGTLTYIFVAQ